MKFHEVKMRPVSEKVAHEQKDKKFNPDSTKFGIVRIQSNPSPVQCSSLLCCAHAHSSAEMIG